MTQSVSRSVGARVQAAGTLLVLVVALGSGALTDLGQAWLPQWSASLANSGASWAAVAFVLALFATGAGRAAAATTWPPSAGMCPSRQRASGSGRWPR